MTHIEIVPRFAESWKEFLDVINNKRAPMFYAAWYADYPDADDFLYVLFHSTSPTNRMAYKNVGTDRLLADARHETDYLKRAELYRKAENQIMSEAPIICLHNNTFNTLFQLWVKGIGMGHLGSAYTPFRKFSMKKKK